MPLLSLFFGSKVGMIISALVIGSIAFFSWLAVHDNEVWNRATEVFNKMQEELVQKKEEEFVEKTEVINDNAARIRETIARRDEQMIEISSGIEKQAITEHKGTEQASKYLKNIIYQLDQNYGEKK